MRIAYFCSLYPAASHTFIRREVRALRARGLEIDTFTLRRAPDLRSGEDREEAEATVSVLPCGPFRLAGALLWAVSTRPLRTAATLGRAFGHRLPGFGPFLGAFVRFAEALVLGRELARRGSGHLHTHFSNAGGDVGFLASGLLGIGWSLTLHGSADFNGSGRPLLGRKIAAARFVACASEHGRGLAAEACDAAFRDRLVVVRCGIDPRRYAPRARPAGRRLRVLSVGRLSPEKGQAGLVEAFARVFRKGVDAELRVIGEGPERPRLEAAAAREGVADRCSFPGSRSEEEVAAELAEADVFALSSTLEGLPVVLMEAMASGLPVVAPRLSGIPELVEDGATGLLYATGRYDELAGLLERLLRDASLRRALAERARVRVEGGFDIARAVLPLEERFREGAAVSRGPLGAS